MNKSSLNDKRKQLRNRPTSAEKILWSHLRLKQTDYKFRRQHSIGRYIVDFYCVQAGLVIEVDGDSHFASNSKSKYDQNRGQYLESIGLRVLRFTDTEVFESLEQVIEIIKCYLSNTPT